MMEVSIRDNYVPVPENGSFFDGLRALSLSIVEIEVAPDLTCPRLRSEAGEPLSLRDASAIRTLKERLEAEGVRPAALLLNTDFSGDEADAHVEWTVNAVRAARELGAPAVRIDPLTSRRELPPETMRDNLVRRLTQVLEKTEDTGVDLGIENHGAFFNDPDLLASVLAAVDHPRLGMTLDTGNFYWYGLPLSDVYDTLARFAPLAKHTHVKNIAYPPEIRETRREIGHEYGRYVATLYDGDIDIGRVAQILRDAGYARTLCVEDESMGKFSKEERTSVLRKDVEALRQAIAEGERK